MNWEWINYLSDSKINDFTALVVKDYKVLAMLIGGPILWALSKWTTWTPWTTDDKLGDMIEKKLGITK